MVVGVVADTLGVERGIVVRAGAVKVTRRGVAAAGRVVRRVVGVFYYNTQWQHTVCVCACMHVCVCVCVLWMMRMDGVDGNGRGRGNGSKTE